MWESRPGGGLCVGYRKEDVEKIEPGEVKTYTLSPEELAKYGPVSTKKNRWRMRKLNKDHLTNLLQKQTVTQVAVAYSTTNRYVEKLAEEYGLELDDKGRLAQEVDELSLVDDLAEKLSRDEYLSLMEQGKTSKEISEQYKFSVQTVDRLKKRYKLIGMATPRAVKAAYGPRVDISKEQLVGYLEKGMSLGQIAKTVGCSKSTIYERRKEFGLDKPQAKKEDVDMQDFNKAVQAANTPEPCETEPEQVVKQAKYTALDAVSELETLYQEIRIREEKITKISRALQNATIEL